MLSKIFIFLSVTIVIVEIMYCSQVGAQYFCPGVTQVFYANGMSNKRNQAEDNTFALELALIEEAKKHKVLRWNKEKVMLAYNYDANYALELLEVYQQKKYEKTDMFWKWYYDWMDSPPWTYLSMVAVAKPASRVFADGPYYTLTSDRVINMLRQRSASLGLLRPLPANVTNQFPKPGWIDHAFVKYYLRGRMTGQKMLESVVSEVKKLKFDEGTDTYYHTYCLDFYQRIGLDPSDPEKCYIDCTTSQEDETFIEENCGLLCRRYCQCARF